MIKSELKFDYKIVEVEQNRLNTVTVLYHKKLTYLNSVRYCPAAVNSSTKKQKQIKYDPNNLHQDKLYQDGSVSLRGQINVPEEFQENLHQTANVLKVFLKVFLKV